MDGLAELHTHLGGSVSSDILWTLAHEQGIALPVKDYWDFDRLVTVSDPRGVPDLDALDAIYHWTELIQSSPAAVEVSVHGAIGGAYRSQGITTLELRFNPMKRNRGGERDLDHIILAAIRGLDVASLEYPQVRAGLILMMDRTFSPHQNEIIVEKAIRWAPRGVVGIDIAGPRPGGGRYDYSQVQPMVEEARAAGLGVTIHVGEEGGEMGRAEIGEVLEPLRPGQVLDLAADLARLGEEGQDYVGLPVGPGPGQPVRRIRQRPTRRRVVQHHPLLRLDPQLPRLRPSRVPRRPRRSAHVTPPCESM